MSDFFVTLVYKPNHHAPAGLLILKSSQALNSNILNQTLTLWTDTK